MYPRRGVDQHPDFVHKRRAGEDLLDGDQRLFTMDDPVSPGEHRFRLVNIECPCKICTSRDGTGIGYLPARLYPVVAEDPADGNIGPHEILPELRGKPPERRAGDRVNKNLPRHAILQLHNAVVDLIIRFNRECSRHPGISGDDLLHQGGDGDRVAGCHLEEIRHRSISPDENLLHRGEAADFLLDLPDPLVDSVYRQGFHDTIGLVYTATTKR